MGEAKRKAQDGLMPRNLKKKKKKAKDDSPRIIPWLPITQKQRTQFIDITIKVGWVGIGVLVLIWVIVRFLGPAAGWWIPADLH